MDAKCYSRKLVFSPFGFYQCGLALKKSVSNHNRQATEKTRFCSFLCNIKQVLGQDDIMCGKGTGIESFTKTVKHILAVMQSGKDQATLVSSLFNVWEENILSLGEGMQEEVGKK